MSLNEKYRKIFGQVIPYVFPVVFFFALLGQFRGIKQSQELQDTKNKLEDVNRQMEKTTVANRLFMRGMEMVQAGNIETREVASWLDEAIQEKVVGGIPAQDDVYGYFSDTFNKLSQNEKRAFVSDVTNKIANPKSGKIIMLKVNI